MNLLMLNKLQWLFIMAEEVKMSYIISQVYCQNKLKRFTSRAD